MGEKHNFPGKTVIGTPNSGIFLVFYGILEHLQTNLQGRHHFTGKTNILQFKIIDKKYKFTRKVRKTLFYVALFFTVYRL